MRRPEERSSRAPSASQFYSTLAETTLEKTRWGLLFYGLQIICVNAITPQSSASDKTQRPNSSQDAELGRALWDRAPWVGEGIAWLPHSHCISPESISQRPLPNRARAVLLDFSSETTFGNHYLCLFVCKQAAHPTVYYSTYQVALQKRTTHGHTSHQKFQGLHLQNGRVN